MANGDRLFAIVRQVCPQLILPSFSTFLPDDLLKALYLLNERMERLKFLFRMYKSFPGKYFCEGCLEYHTEGRSSTSIPTQWLQLHGHNAVSHDELEEVMYEFHEGDGSLEPLGIYGGAPVPVDKTRWYGDAEFRYIGGTLLLRITH